MVEKIECLKVDDEIFQIGDIVEIEDCTIDKGAYTGRISGFEKVDNHIPPNYGVILDTSTKFNNKRLVIRLELIKRVKKVD